MLKTFAPKVIKPPSPKNKACIPSTTEIPNIAAQGPNTTARSVPPTACPVVPPGKGTLNIIKTKAKAAKSASTGTVRWVRTLRTRFTARYQKGRETAYMVPQVTGLKYPSGMCILYSPFFSAIDAYNKKQGKWNPELNSVFAGFAK